MNEQQTRPRTATETRIATELRATLSAYHELGGAYEEQVVDSFLDRIRPVIQPPAWQAPPPVRYRPHYGRGRGLLIGLAILIAWFMLSGPLFGHARFYRYGSFGIGAPQYSPPGMTVPAAPAQPQPPSSTIQ